MKTLNFASCFLASWAGITIVATPANAETKQFGQTAKIVPSGLPDLPETVTSFGGAIAKDALYVYGGHTGSAHSYSVAEQSNLFYALSYLEDSPQWRPLPSGPRLQGLALVPAGEDVIRVGGFTALNAEGEDQNLQSQSDVSRFDVSSGRWQALPPLPEPRSSHDAAVLGNHVYVVGGWHLSGKEKTHWHTTAWKLDLEAVAAGWKPVAQPPTTRRALSLAAHDGSLFAIGGMQQKGGPTTSVDVYDPKTDQWASAPALPGAAMNGFGNAAFATGGNLYVTTIHGNALRLSTTDQTWTQIAQVDPPRFFHRLLPADDSSLLIIGGANMEEGKYTAIDRMKVD